MEEQSISNGDTDDDLPLLSTGDDVIIPVGVVGGLAAQLVIERSGIVDVNTVSSVQDHWRSGHAGQYDPAVAESMIAGVLRDPLRVLQGEKPSTLVFLGDYSETKYLVLPVKCLKGELWIGTMFVANKARYDKKRWVRDGVLYQKD